MAQPEQDIRLNILNTLLTTPHRKLDQIWPVHREMAAQDPLFYGRLAAWYFDHGDVRDHKEMFVVTLALSEFDGHRDVGLALLRRLPPYQVARVVDFIHGRKTSRKVVVRPKQQTRAKRQSAARRLIGKVVGRKPKEEPEVACAPRIETQVESFGLFRNVPRSLKTEVARYLREREADADWFDSMVLSARNAIKRLYAVLHVPPSERAQRVLFDREPPADSRIGQLRILAQAETPADQARAIVEHRIPYRVAATVIRQMTPTVLAALIQQMSPQELINNLGALKRRGALQNADLKSLIDQKLEQARSSRRVSAFKAEEAVKAAGVSAELREKLEQVADAQVKAKGRITRPTALFVDKSASMHDAIELGKRIGAMISAVCERELFVYAFDTLAYPVECRSTEMAAWERAFRGINAGGATSCGAPLVAMRQRKQSVEQIILITDEGENTHPYFVRALEEYRAAMQADPNVFIVRTPGGGRQLETDCRTAGVPVDVFQFNGDYYSLPNLIPLLSRPSRLELLLEILSYPLPERQAA
jgi:hypothetical protein